MDMVFCNVCIVILKSKTLWLSLSLSRIEVNVF